MNLRPIVAGSVVFGFTVLALGACTEPVELADWTLPVPEGTRLIEHEVLPLEERSDPAVRFEEDLVLGEQGVDADLTFYGLPYFAVGDDGRVYALDMGNHRVLVFGPAGRHLMTLGRQGQGPGEFQLGSIGSIEVTENRIRVDDRGNNRLSIWTLDGDFLEARSTPIGAQFRVHFFQGLPNGTRVAFVTVLHDDGSQSKVATIVDDDTEEVRRLGEHRDFGGLPSKRHDYELSIFAPSLRFATARDGRIYLEDGTHYQILALRPTGEPEWAMRAVYQPKPYPEEYKERIVDLRRQNPRVSDLQVSDFDWPERAPALRGVLVDGHGHLYVIPLTFPLSRDEFPVDVFSQEGELLYSGTMRGGWWSAALGDHVYGTRENETGDYVIARYRIVEPFE